MDIFKNVSGIFKTLCNPGISKIAKGCNYFRNISFSRFLLYEINIMSFFKTNLIFTPDVLVLCKKVSGPRGPGSWI